MQDFEKLGVFYLGRLYDLEKRARLDELLLYDSKDLVTHAVCVGMTGSGKTGLCIGLLEEAALDGIPAIIVDPKGDLPNLLLTFPGLSTQEFLPWVNEDDARKLGVSTEEYARQQAELWKKGLAEWGQDGERIRRLRESADFAIYTPGSTAGLPVSIVASFAAPPQGILDEDELLRERVNTTVTSLLNLMGIQADPLQSREHILLSNILDHAWRQGQDMELAGLIHAIQSPPMNKIGVFDVESFFPTKERFNLAMRLNNLLAAPGFATWLEGEPLDIDRILYTPEGKPRMAIFSIAHLNDAERMFFVSLLLNQILGWMRTQSGTSSLRALFYMDEIYGYFPPVANPPAKAPLMTLLKQARAFGLGIVLATQNPVDLDYKGLANTGTWFIGRLQTERDKQRLLDGLEGANLGGGFDRRRMEQTLAGLGKRVFLMHNVHEKAPVTFETRWAMSYLCGPLTRAQIKTLMDERKKAAPRTGEGQGSAATLQPSRAKEVTAARPVLDPGIPQCFIPVRQTPPPEAKLCYEPMLLGVGRVYYLDRKTDVSTEDKVALLADLPERPSLVNWEGAYRLDIDEERLEQEPRVQDARFGQVSAEATKKANYAAWSKDFQEWLFRTQTLQLLKSPSLGLVSKPGEAERDFRIRLQMATHEQRDEQVARLRQKYAARLDALQERVRRAELTLAREAEQARQQKMQTAISVGTTLLGAFLGRRAVTQSTIGRATTAARGASRTFKEEQDVRRAEESLAAARRELAEAEQELTREIQELQARSDPRNEALETVVLRPRKSDVAVSLVALAWAPHWEDQTGRLTPAW
ncbi:MAG: ATP-binding protein [candidate division KSB1 bacterium]|nr:ATP-binding protein [candidate division KSB1 bacterium]